LTPASQGMLRIASKPPESRKEAKGISPYVSEASPRPHLDFRFLAFRNVR